MNNFWNNEPAVDQGLALVQRRIDETAAGARGFIRPYLQEKIRQQGKMLRPACVLLCSRMGEGGSDQVRLATDLAAGIELIHAASLVHDDIVDEAPLRRGEPTLHSIIGNRKAVVAGDYLMARAFSLFSHSSIERIDAGKVSDRIGRLCESEIDQDSEIGNFFISVTHYLRRIGGKTASLFSLACYLGAAAGNLSPLHVRRLTRFGYNLGMSFQIQDDILDYSGDREQMGKEAGKDLQDGIATLPLLCSLSRDTGELRSLVSSHPMNNEQLEQAVGIIISLGGVDDARNISSRYQKRALQDLHALPNSESREALARLLHRLTDRKH